MYQMETLLKQKCKQISAGHIKSLLLTPPFLDVLLAYEGELDDETVCKIVCDTALATSVFNPSYCNVYKEARHVYNDVYGEIPLFLYPRAHTLPGFEDQMYLLEVLDPLSYHSKRVLLAHICFLKTAREFGIVKNIQSAYLVFEKVFFDMIRRKYRFSKSEMKRNQYMVFRNIADEFCRIVFEDPTVWRERLAAKLQ